LSKSKNRIRRRHFFATAIAAATTLAVCQNAAAQAAPTSKAIPVEHFFNRPDIDEMRLSPDGRWVAATVRGKNERLNLVMMDLEGKEAPAILVQLWREDVVNVRWVNDQWLIFEVADIVSNDGDWRGQGLMAITRTADRKKVLIKNVWETEFGNPGAGPLEANHGLLAMGAWGGNEIIIGEYVYGPKDLERIRPFALDISTGARRQLLNTTPANVQEWLFDSKGRPRAAVSFDAGKSAVHWWDQKTDAWRRVAEYSVLDVRLRPVGIVGESELLMSTTDAQGFSEIRQVEVGTSLTGNSGTVVVSTPGFSSAARPVISRETGEWVGVRLNTEMSWTQWRDPVRSRIQAEADAMLPDRNNDIQFSTGKSPKRVLVRSSSDRDPGEYLLYEPESKKWQRLGARRADIAPKDQMGMEFHRIPTRDGQQVPTWITRPAGANKMPAVVLVHGGPWVRGTYWSWDREAQFLASRGYVVIQPEFRGSTGFGYDHFRAGWKQWGQAMQDDVSDALKFAVAKGWVDKDRVCIAGASYGGYSTLMGLAKNPEQYRCGIAWVAVSDPQLLYEAFWSDLSGDAKNYTMPEMIGDRTKDAAMLRANSPLEQAARIKAPVLLAYGGRDRRVPIEHGQRMREALTKSGNKPEWVVYDNEGHGWSRVENQQDFWKRVEKFLAENLKVR
jgi:dipeptidyl aminopeptidase/acylaminoacyl peptidase